MRRVELMRRAGAGLLSLALAACTMGPDYHRALPPAPAQWHQSLPPAPTQATIATLTPDWWTLFNDPRLTALEAQVASANLDLKLAATRFQQSEAERSIAHAARLPQLGLDASYARERASPNGVMSLLGTTTNQSSGTIASGQSGFGPAGLTSSSGESKSFDLPQYGVSASWELDLWGRVRRQVEAAKANMEAAQDDRRAMLVSLMAETAQDYIALRAVQAQIALTRQHVDLARSSVELTHLRRGEGAASRLDEAQSAGRQHEYEALLPVLEAQESHLINALSYLAGREPGALQAQLGSAGAIPPLPEALPVGLPSQLAERRPDVRAAEERLHAATASIGVATADFFPRVTLSGSLDMQALQWGNLASWSSRQYGVGPSISFPLFEGGRLKGQLRLRKAEQREAAIALQRATLKAWHEIDDAMARLSAAQRQRHALDEAIVQDRVALDVARRQDAQGAGDRLQVIVAENALLTSESAQVAASADISTAAAQLYRALGGGWETAYPELKEALPRP